MHVGVNANVSICVQYVFSHEWVLACLFVLKNSNSVEGSLTWLNSHNHPKAYGKSVGGQVRIDDRGRRAGRLDWVHSLTHFNALVLSVSRSGIISLLLFKITIPVLSG